MNAIVQTKWQNPLMDHCKRMFNMGRGNGLDKEQANQWYFSSRKQTLKNSDFHIENGILWWLFSFWLVNNKNRKWNIWLWMEIYFAVNAHQCYHSITYINLVNSKNLYPYTGSLSNNSCKNVNEHLNTDENHNKYISGKENGSK